MSDAAVISNATNSGRQSRFRERMAKNGLVPITVYVPRQLAATVTLMAKELCENRHLEPGPLRNLRNGRYRAFSG